MIEISLVMIVVSIGVACAAVTIGHIFIATRHAARGEARAARRFGGLWWRRDESEPTEDH